MTETTVVQDIDRFADIHIRQLIEEDLPALEWEGEFTHFRRLYAEAYRRAQRGLSVLWIAESLPSNMVGQVFIQLSCDRPELCNGFDRAYLYAFRVRAPYRSKGIGARMLEVAEDDLKMRGFAWLTLNVARDNPRAHQFYLNHGFRVVAPEPGCWSYIDDKGRLQQVVEPAWRMEKRI